MTVGQIGYAVGADRGLRRLPERVVDAWCVQISDMKPVLPKAVLVGAHQDLYNADWIVHEPVAQTTEELNRWLADVGCDMVITP